MTNVRIGPWTTPVVIECSVGMEVTSYESAEMDGDGGTVFHFRDTGV